jgi:hypothetical protein
MILIDIAAKGIKKETDSTGDVVIEGMKISTWVTKRAWLGRDLQLGVAGNFQRQHHLIPRVSASNQISTSNTGRRFACDHKNAVGIFCYHGKFRSDTVRANEDISPIDD